MTNSLEKASQTKPPNRTATKRKSLLNEVAATGVHHTSLGIFCSLRKKLSGTRHRLFVLPQLREQPQLYCSTVLVFLLPLSWGQILTHEVCGEIRP